MDRFLPMLLLRARESVMAAFRPILREHGLTEQQWRVLRALAEASPLDPTSLAARAALMPPSLSRILRDLEARELIERKPTAGGKRRYEVGVTKEGLALILAIAPHSAERYRRIGEAIGEDALDRLIALLERIEGLNLAESEEGPR
jgi:homoprotocatechuate degradation regulator HpaR